VVLTSAAFAVPANPAPTPAPIATTATGNSWRSIRFVT